MRLEVFLDIHDVDTDVLNGIGLVGHDGLRGRVLEQGICALEVMGLPRCEEKACRVAWRINRGMDLGAQATPAASDGLLVWIPPFAPALC